MSENKPADPQAPVTRKGFLISIKTGDPTEIKERDVVSGHKSYKKIVYYKIINI